jgi:hypothetical protein
MKPVITTAFITLTLLSCTKQKQASIVGVWEEVSVYSKINTGSYSWDETASGFSYILRLNSDGTYSGHQCVSTGGGTYQYDHATRRIRMEDISSGNIETITVADLNDDYLILDYGMTSMGEYKVKFIRLEY